MKGIRGVADVAYTNVDKEISMISDTNVIGYSFFVPQSSPYGATVSVNGGVAFPVEPGDSFPFGGMASIAGCPLVFQDILTVKFTTADADNRFFVTKVRVPEITEVQ